MVARNSKVYAARVRGQGALFARRPLEVGEILVRYTGPLLTHAQADASTSKYLMTAYCQTRAGGTRRTTIDGQGELAGFANHADWDAANAFVVDLLPHLLAREAAQRTAIVLVAKRHIRGHGALRRT